MRPRDWFSVGVRLLGVWIFFERGFSYLLAFGAERLRLDKSPLVGGIDTEANEQYYFWYALGCTAFALYLVFGAEHLTRLAFREATDSSADRLVS